MVLGDGAADMVRLVWGSSAANVSTSLCRHDFESQRHGGRGEYQ
jgi:hypothetical protein